MASAMLSTAAGLAVGVPVALGLTQYAATLLFEVQPLDPVFYVVALGVMVAAAVAAAYVPASRASRLNPMGVLCSE